MANKQHAQFSDENGNLFYLENQTEDVLDPSGKPLSDGGDLSEASVKFSVDTSRKLPQSGGRFKAFLGSIVKYLTDLGAAAYLAVANNDTTTQPGFVGDARVLKQHRDAINQLNSELDNVGATYDPIVGTMSVGNNELTNICNTWLVKGIYFINTHIRATLPTECNFEQYILVDDAQDPRGSSSKVLGAGFNDSNMGFILEIKATSSNVVLQARQYSGERVSIDGWIFVTRIK